MVLARLWASAVINDGVSALAVGDVFDAELFLTACELRRDAAEPDGLRAWGTDDSGQPLTEVTGEVVWVGSQLIWVLDVDGLRIAVSEQCAVDSGETPLTPTELRRLLPPQPAVGTRVSVRGVADVSEGDWEGLPVRGWESWRVNSITLRGLRGEPWARELERIDAWADQADQLGAAYFLDLEVVRPGAAER